jgi:methionine synthase I (cobalamin-dependent)
VLSNISFSDLSENYYQQAKYLIEGSVDVLLVERVHEPSKHLDPHVFRHHSLRHTTPQTFIAARA